MAAKVEPFWKRKTLAQLDQDVAEINRKKKEALTTFDTVTRTIISDEITSSGSAESTSRM